MIKGSVVTSTNLWDKPILNSYSAIAHQNILNLSGFPDDIKSRNGKAHTHTKTQVWKHAKPKKQSLKCEAS